QAFRKPAGDREPGQAGHVGRDGEQVAGVHGQRIGRLGAERKGDGGRGRAHEQVVAAEQLLVLATDQRPHLLGLPVVGLVVPGRERDRKSTRLNSSHVSISYAVFCLKKKKKKKIKKNTKQKEK